jgi:hypothetical protein
MSDELNVSIYHLTRGRWTLVYDRKSCFTSKTDDLLSELCSFLLATRMSRRVDTDERLPATIDLDHDNPCQRYVPIISAYVPKYLAVVRIWQ